MADDGKQYTIFCGGRGGKRTKLERAFLVEVLAKHSIIEIRCDHDAKTDEAICACGTWPAPKMPSVGQAITAWAEHVVDVLERNRFL